MSSTKILIFLIQKIVIYKFWIRNIKTFVEDTWTTDINTHEFDTNLYGPGFGLGVCFVLFGVRGARTAEQCKYTQVYITVLQHFLTLKIQYDFISTFII